MAASLNYIDLILVSIIGLTVYNGWRTGFINSFIEIAIWLGSFLLALFLSEHTISLLKLFNVSGIWVRPVFFIILLIGFSRLILLACDRLSSSVSEETHSHWANKLAGILPGLLSGTIYGSLLAFFLLAYSLGNVSLKANESKLAGNLTAKAEWPGRQISDLFSTIGYKLGSSLTIHPSGMEIIRLPFKTANFNVRKDLELMMLQLINSERKKEGLKIIAADRELAGVARKHSADMFKRGYFSHYTPEGKSPFDRIRKDGINFMIAGENLALAQTLQLAHEGLMESTGHRANIMHTSFGRVGIGILDGGIHGVIVTQVFRN
ncbi:MAG: CvpA family protein [Daejeonella sp.]